MTVHQAPSDDRMPDITRYFEAVQFLNLEARVLDEHRYDEWLALLDEEVRYVMPVRVTAIRGQDTPIQSSLCHLDEDHYSLSKRVERLRGEHAWTENPESRTRRFVTNVSAVEGDSDDHLHCSSYILLFRSRLDVRVAEWISAQRTDQWRRVDGSFRLVERRIDVDESVLRTQNLAVFL